MDDFLFLPRALAAALFDVAFAAGTGFTLLALMSDVGITVIRAVQGCVLGMVAALAAQVWLAIATTTGSTKLEIIRSEFLDVLGGTHAGRIAIVSFSLALLSLAICFLRRCPRGVNRSILVISIVLGAVRGASGHAAVHGTFSLAEAVQFLHVESTAVWSGTVMAAGFYFLPGLRRLGNSDRLSAFALRLSRTATVALALVLLSGAYNAWLGLGLSVSPLAHTQWGRLLAFKLVMVTAAICCGAYSRSLIRIPGGIVQKRSERLVRVLRCEAALMVLILILSAFLANSASPQ